MWFSIHPCVVVIQVYEGPIDAADVERAASLRGVLQRHLAPSHCTAVVKSGVPPRELLFKTAACAGKRYGRLPFNLASMHAQSTASGSKAFHILMPVLLPLARADGRYGSLQRPHDLLLFMTTRGEVSAVNSKGELLWKNVYAAAEVLTAASGAQEEEGGVAGGVGATPGVATFEALSLRRHAVPSAVLVAGSRGALILSEHGHVLEQLSLPHAPSQAIQIMDFSGDGLNDLVVVTQHGVYGYAQVARPGGVTLSAILLTLIMAMAVVYYSQVWVMEGGSAAGGSAAGYRARKLRSTDYTD